MIAYNDSKTFYFVMRRKKVGDSRANIYPRVMLLESAGTISAGDTIGRRNRVASAGTFSRVLEASAC